MSHESSAAEPAALGQEEKRLIPAPNTVAIRLYGQGLGDCFLLAFPKPEAPRDPAYFVIDCGIAKGTPEEKERMRAVVQDIQAATGGKIDVLAVTHQHYDHISGFLHARDLWEDRETLRVASVWLPWTENLKDEEARGLQKTRNSLNRAAIEAARRALALEDVEEYAGLRAQSGFLGIDPDELGPGGEGAEFGAATGMDLAMKIAAGLGTPVYCEPGDVRAVPGTSFLAYVLGPPRGKDRDGNPLTKECSKKPLVKLLEDHAEMYSYTDLGIKPSEPGTHQMSLRASPVRDAFAGAFGDRKQAEYDRFCPFDPSLRTPWDEALLEPFFWEHYTSGPEWRRVDEDWLGGGSDLALRAGGFTNNISLVLAFELPVSKKVLLFPGDAQVGNWLSWHRITRWEWEAGLAGIQGAEAPTGKPDMKDLLGRVAFYKVGHHGSHNATIKEHGLEMMAKGADGQETELLAYVPVSVPVAHDVMKYCPMPFYPLMCRLHQKTEGKLFLANGKRVNERPGQPLPEGVELSPELLEPKVYRGNRIEESVPLWLQITLMDHAE